MKRILTYSLFESSDESIEMYLRDIFQECIDLGYYITNQANGSDYVRLTVEKPPFRLSVGRPFKYDLVLLDSVESSIEYMKSNGFQHKIKYAIAKNFEFFEGSPAEGSKIVFLIVEFFFINIK